jgi:hypothetical protein
MFLNVAKHECCLRAPTMNLSSAPPQMLEPSQVFPPTLVIRGKGDEPPDRWTSCLSGEKADHMSQEIPEPDRIRELEDALKEAERHIYLSSSGCTHIGRSRSCVSLITCNRGEYRFSAVSSFQTDRKHLTDALRKAGCRNNSRIFCMSTELVGF